MFPLALAATAALAASPEPYFPADYAAGRAAFRASAAALAARWPGATRAAFRVPSARDADLTVDTLSAPATEAPETLVVLISGVHGAEGYAGSAIQQMFQTELAPQLDPRRTGLFVVHAMNPFGFKHMRRATENNVNLNRNFSTGSALYATVNADYPVIARALEPAGAVRGTTRNSWALALAVGQQLVCDFSLARLSEAIGAGQYASDHGLEFGGHAAEPQVADFLAQLKRIAAPYRDVILLDLHTGLGEAYQLHLMPGDADGAFDRPLFDRAFDRAADADLYAYTPNDSAGFYRTHGDVNNVLAEIKRPGQRAIGLTMEFGTLGDSVVDKLRTLNRLVLENQGFQHGYATPALAAEVSGLFRALFFPDDAAWRRNVIARSRRLFVRMFERLARRP